MVIEVVTVVVSANKPVAIDNACRCGKAFKASIWTGRGIMFSSFPSFGGIVKPVDDQVRQATDICLMPSGQRTFALPQALRSPRSQQPRGAGIDGHRGGGPAICKGY